jgi:hypothetical protein
LEGEDERETTFGRFFVNELFCFRFANNSVEYAKPVLRAELIAAGQAVAYSEPAETVISRSGEECVVALTNQWSITYGDPAWRDPVLEHVKDPSFQTFSDGMSVLMIVVLFLRAHLFETKKKRMQDESGSLSGVDAALGNQSNVWTWNSSALG